MNVYVTSEEQAQFALAYLKQKRMWEKPKIIITENPEQESRKDRSMGIKAISFQRLPPVKSPPNRQTYYRLTGNRGNGGLDIAELLNFK